MQWFRELAPLPLKGLALAVCLGSVYALVFVVLLWLWGAGGALAAGGVLAAAVAVWELAWERPRRAKQRLSIFEARQQAPGTQPLRSAAGTPHWTDKLPRPLALATRSAPVTVATLSILAITFVVVEVLAGLGGGDGDVHFPLARASSGKVQAIPGGPVWLRLTILDIADGSGTGTESQGPATGMKYWAVEVEIENIGHREFDAPAWKLLDSEDIEHDPVVLEQGRGAGAPVPSPTPRLRLGGGSSSKSPETAQPVWLRVTPSVLHESVLPNHLYFDAD